MAVIHKLQRLDLTAFSLNWESYLAMRMDGVDYRAIVLWQLTPANVLAIAFPEICVQPRQIQKLLSTGSMGLPDFGKH